MGKKLIPFLAIPVIIFMASCSVTSPPQSQESFEFSSGGAYHISGYGECQIILQKDGNFSISHNLAGKVTSIRTWYTNGLEVEYGITDEDWSSLPLDEGTRQVIQDGIVEWFDRNGILALTIENCSNYLVKSEYGL